MDDKIINFVERFGVRILALLFIIVVLIIIFGTIYLIILAGKA